MILGFSTRFPKNKGALTGKKTSFPEKIWYSITSEVGIDDDEYEKWHGEEGILHLNMGNNFNDSLFSSLNPKHHTIRKDPKNRWVEGKDIHFNIDVRKKSQFQFAPVINVKSTQKIEIKVVDDAPAVAYTRNGKTLGVFVDGRRLKIYEIDQLATNDGFDNTLDFFEWFNEDFTGKIIHWTELKY